MNMSNMNKKMPLQKQGSLTVDDAEKIIKAAEKTQLKATQLDLEAHKELQKGFQGDDVVDLPSEDDQEQDEQVDEEFEQFLMTRKMPLLILSPAEENDK